MEIIAIIALVIIYKISQASLEYKVDNYKMSKVDTSKLCADAYKGPETVKRNLVSGKYDKK